MKKLLAASAIAMALSFAGTAAQAAPLTFSSNGVATFSNVITTGAGSTFSDNYTFSLPGNSSASGSLTTITLGQLLGLAINSVTLTNPTTNTVFNAVLNSSSTATGTNYSIPVTLLTGGSYKLNIAGSVSGLSGGFYAGGLNVAAVPEASTTAMMLGGLALVGFVALRRRRNEDSKSFAASQMTAA